MPRAVEQPSGQPGDLYWRPVPYSAWAKLLLYGLQAKNGLYILKWYNNKNQIRSYKSPCIMSVSVQKSVKPATCPLVTTHEGSEILSYLQASKRGHCSVMAARRRQKAPGSENMNQFTTTAAICCSYLHVDSRGVRRRDPRDRHLLAQ